MKMARRSVADLSLHDAVPAEEFRHLFIVMGRGVHLRKWMQTVLGSADLSHVNLVLGVFDEGVESLGQCASARVDCVPCAGTSWVAGRNLLARRAFQWEQALNIRHAFWTFADGDIELLCQLGRDNPPVSDPLACFSLYDRTLRSFPLGAAIVSLIGTGWWSLQEGMVMVGLQGFDAAWNSFRREALPLLLPYLSDLDHHTWWSAQAIFWNRVMCFAPYYAVAPLSLLYVNPEHNDYPKNARNFADERIVGDRLMGALASVVPHAPTDYPAQFSAAKVRPLPLEDTLFDSVYRTCSREFVGSFYSFVLGGPLGSSS
jgi:hypothetical protein